MVDNKYPVTTVVTVNSCYIFYCIQYIYNVNLVDKCRKVKENIRYKEVLKTCVYVFKKPFTRT